MARDRSGSMDHSGIFLVGMLTGLLVGTTIGMLYAPHRGEVTRRRLRRRVGDMRDQVDEAVEDLRAGR
ncbi:MAG: YtxH domain-containing protein [Candidatus Latescibacterota bacterium]